LEFLLSPAQVIADQYDMNCMFRQCREYVLSFTGIWCITCG